MVPNKVMGYGNTVISVICIAIETLFICEFIFIESIYGYLFSIFDDDDDKHELMIKTEGVKVGLPSVNVNHKRITTKRIC